MAVCFDIGKYLSVSGVVCVFTPYRVTAIEKLPWRSGPNRHRLSQQAGMPAVGLGGAGGLYKPGRKSVAVGAGLWLGVKINGRAHNLGQT